MRTWSKDIWDLVLTATQEFSIEIPDKEADAIHSGMPYCEPSACGDELMSRSEPSGRLHHGTAGRYAVSIHLCQSRTNNFQLTRLHNMLRRSW